LPDFLFISLKSVFTKNQLSFHSYFTQANSTIMADIIVCRILTTTGTRTGIIIHHQYYVKVQYNQAIL